MTWQQSVCDVGRGRRENRDASVGSVLCNASQLARGPVWVASSPELVLVTHYKRGLATDTAHSSSRLAPASLRSLSARARSCRELRRRRESLGRPRLLVLEKGKVTRDTGHHTGDGAESQLCRLSSSLQNIPSTLYLIDTYRLKL